MLTDSPEARARVERELHDEKERERLRRQVQYTPGWTAEALHARLFQHAPKIGVEATRRRLQELSDAGCAVAVVDRWYGPDGIGLRTLVDKGLVEDWTPLLSRVRDAGPDGLAKTAITSHRPTRDLFSAEDLIERADAGSPRSPTARWKLSRRGTEVLNLLRAVAPLPSVDEPFPLPALKAPEPDPKPAPEPTAADEPAPPMVETVAVLTAEPIADTEASVDDVNRFLVRLRGVLDFAQRQHATAVRVAREADDLAARVHRAIEALDALRDLPEVVR